MNRHQILSGACNAGDRCYAVGSVEGIPFTAYAAGCNIVILASTFERVQIIPGAVHGYIKISALDCSTDTGKIAAAYEDKICIFEPTPLIHADTPPTHNLEYKWVQTGTLQTTSNVSSLSWNLEGTRLLTGGTTLQMWREKISVTEDNDPPVVRFEIGGDRDPRTPTNEKDDEIAWECIWTCQTATPVHHMTFSPDGTLFATSGRNDRLVKIWYENKHVLFPTKSFDSSQFRSGTFDDSELNYGFVYIAHPRAVTQISWRKTSKYMPKGSVSNMLVTSCLDNICRIWIETVLPDDGLVNMNQFDPLASQNPKFRTHRHKHRFMQRLKHMKTCFHIRRHAKNGAIVGSVAPGFGGPGADTSIGHSPIPSLPSTYSVHDFHSYGYHGTGVSPGVHFHLAASINAETDIPLVPSMQTTDPSNQPNFILHWLNNKEMNFTMTAEAILQELTKKTIEKEDIHHMSNGNSHAEEAEEHHGEESRKKFSKSQKSFSHEESNSEEHSSKHSTFGAHSGIPNVNSMSNTTSSNSLVPDNPSGHVTDSLDVKIDCLLRDWHHSPDLLFAIHPVDGSYLIWIIEWLDDYYPGSFRQAQVSFSTRIPSAFPLGDAMSMSTTVSLYNTGCSPLFFREMVKGAKKQSTGLTQENNSDSQVPLPSVVEEQDDESINAQSGNEDAKSNVDETDEKKATHAEAAQKSAIQTDVLSAQPSPTISMVTKHSNGTLNLWQLTFADKTKFTQVLSIGHVCRASGHRFRVNDITCHPVLPLLLTTSHHNIPDSHQGNASKSHDNQNKNRDICGPTGFCSELILWRVDSVGPLSHSGGVSELARINSPEISAFSNVAWIPTLLPSTTLGKFSNSPSACFVASDGECLRVYQAVIDARTLLAEVSCSERICKRANSFASISTECSSDPLHKHPLFDKIKIVSQQSTARPGCITQLDAIEDATHDWQNTQFLHVFQEQLITGEKNDNRMLSGLTESVNAVGLMESQLGAIVDLQRSVEFEEPFYIVIIERTTKGSTIHMWRIVISSKSQSPYLSESAMYVPDSNLVQDLDDAAETGPRHSVSGLNLLEQSEMDVEAPHVTIVTKKVCTQELPLPDGVDVVHASPAGGHLSSSSIYPACFAPYIIVTACSDSTTRFWKCDIKSFVDENSQVHMSYDWNEWKMLSKNQESVIEISGQPLNISAAYSGRIACAYKYGKSFTRPHKGDPDSRYVNLCVAIYECESTGGSEWVLEDTIHLKNVHLPRIQIDPNLDLSYLHDNRFLQKKQRLNQVIQTFTHEDNRSPRSGEITPELMPKPAAGLLAVPSFSTLQSLRKSITENGNTCPLTQKHLVQLDWVSKEDGSHILTVAVGSKILLYTPVSSDLAQANMKAMKESQTTNRPILRKASSLAQPHFNDEIRWMKLRQIDLETADGLPPLPMQISWVRDGILVVGMDSEMHVYSQWKPRISQLHTIEDLLDNRNLRDEDLRSLAHEASNRRLANVASMPHLSRVSSVNLQILSDKKKKASSQNSGSSANGHEVVEHDYMTDFGLFQASRIACPVLPQYHPKQLMELLNSGKIRWVKAILAYLVRCMSGTYNYQGSVGDEDSINKQKAWARSRTLSVSYVGATSSPTEKRGSTSQIPEELALDYDEITSIPPLPLWVLLSADKEATGQMAAQKEENDGYDQLFDATTGNETSLDDYLDSDSEPRRCDRRQSVPERQSISHFGPRQGQLLSRVLTHTHLPGLSSLDQMHLLALADTVATCNTDFSERFAIDAAKRAMAKENLTGVSDGAENASTDSLDDCGLRFLLAMKHYSYLLRCLPLTQRSNFQKQGVNTSNLVWAFHSESEDELLNLIPSYSKGQIKWSTLKELGVGWWLRSNALLKQCIEKLAKAAYQVKQDPLDAAIFYLAMKKKNIVKGLFKSQRDEKMFGFFGNNFEEPRWRTAALKNAFVLLGKQRFEHSVAFFLLANSLKDAIQVCLNNLEDFQLALVITRLYECEEHDLTPPAYKQLLYEHILGCDMEGINQDISKAHPDPFLRSIALWQLKNYPGSLNTLLENNVGLNHPAYNDEDALNKGEGAHTTNPNVFNFYIYLRTHPLLIRQQIATTAQEKKRAQVVLAGFSYNGEIGSGGGGGGNDTDKQLQIDDAITPLERQLYFTTAHGHFKAGCPALALEVLSKLPSKVLESYSNNEVIVSSEEDKDKQIHTGILEWSSTTTSTISKTNQTASSIDWGQPAVTQAADNFDWGAPVSSMQQEEEFKIVWEDDDNKDDEDDDDDDDGGGLTFKTNKEKEENVTKAQDDGEDKRRPHERLDIMAQQLKFVACLKILMEELSTLATGFEVDGGQLRYQLYIWLEREVIALKQLCNYSSKEIDAIEENANLEMMQSEQEKSNILRTERPTLHEILLQENQDFEAKVKRAARRKRWLKANETLLRTLLSYCSLHGASGGGLASVRMELLLLLQELQQEKTQQQLTSPLPFPTTLPLLSACVAGNKTVTADPIRYLQSHTQDMLQTIIGFRAAPIGLKDDSNDVYVLRDLAIALSSCIYQSLCDSETSLSSGVESTGYQSPGIENLAKLNASFQCSHLMVNANIHNRRRKYSMDEPPTIITPPPKWPGVTNLRALLAREKDEDTPRLNVLLLESFMATFMSLLVYALATCDCHILYRLVGQDFTSATWALLFGGGTKKLLRKPTTENHLHRALQSENGSQENGDGGGGGGEGGMWSAMTSMTKQRVRLNMKILGHFTNPSNASSMKEDKPTYREQFVPPEMSMVSYFLIKPSYGGPCEEDYDSDNSEYSEVEEEEEEDVFADPATIELKNSRKDNTEHLNPNSYSWTILRAATVKLIQHKLQEYINVAGIELQELPVASPLSHGILRIMSQWQESLTEELYMKGPAPTNYIPGCFVETEAKGPAIHKYRALLERHNTPFLGSSAAGPARRLWNYLVRQEHIQDIFIRAVFGKKRQLPSDLTSNASSDPNAAEELTLYENGSDHANPSNPDPIRVIHKEQESISAFCINQVTPGLIAIATPREIQEMDISLLLESPHWYEDECEYDIMNLSKDSDTLPTSSFLVIQTSTDKHILNQVNANIQNYNTTATPQTGIASQSGRGTSVVLKHKIDNVKRMSSHPLMPIYITGGQDGSVQLWEWGHQQVVCTPRPPGTFAKVTRCRFSQHGNKFGIADGDGNLSLWQAGIASQSNRSFFNYQCHNKGISDFVFLGSCSLVATAGHSSENKNVGIWDTLLPQKKSLVASFTCHDQGASSLVYAPQHQVLISAGKKGDVCIFDVRQRTLRQRLQVHDSSVKCLAVDPHEEIFVTGSADGDIKIWSLTNCYRALHSYMGEHARSSFFKHIGQGVSQLHIDSHGRLFSCGSDGSMKVRQLSEMIVQTI